MAAKTTRPPIPAPHAATKRRRHFIQEWRKFRGISQAALGERIDLTGATVSRIENGEIGYTQETLENIADVLVTHPSTLLARPPAPADAIEAPKRRA